MTSVALPLLLLLCLHIDARGKENSCSLKSQRNIVMKVPIMGTLKINCTAEHCGMKPNVTWCKIGPGSFCTLVNETTHIKINRGIPEAEKSIFFLEFVNISMEDSGRYQCKTSGNISNVSYAINVTVTAAKDSGNSQTNETRTSPPNDTPPGLDWLFYTYILSGVLVLVVIVVVTACVLKRKGSTPKNAEHSPGIPSSAVLAPVPAPAPARRSPKRTKRPPVKAAPPPSSTGAAGPGAAGSSGAHDNDWEDAEPPIVYVALDHQVARNGPSRGYIAMGELTEYAAIRLS